MRRTIPVIAATAGGLALVANFHASPKAPTLKTAAARSPTTVSPSVTDPPVTAPAPTSTTATPGRRTIDGPVVFTDYGDVQVRVSLNGSQLVDVEALKLPNDRQRSVRISNAAGPLLRNEALRAQSANIDLVSGASYTSEGYIESLQGALDQARQ